MKRKYWIKFEKWKIGKGAEEYERGLTNLREVCGYPDESCLEKLNKKG